MNSDYRNRLNNRKLGTVEVTAMKALTGFSGVVAMCVLAFGTGGCGKADSASSVDSGPDFSSTIMLDTPVLLDSSAGPCTQPHTVCMTVQMPSTIPGPPTHVAVGYYKVVPVKAPAEARGVIQSPPLVAGQQFRLMAGDGNLTGALYPVVLLYMPGGGDIIAVDNLDYTAEATQTYDFTGAPLNVTETLNLVYGI
jgi:hypothetical protein